MGAFSCHDAVMESLPVNLLQVCVSLISTGLFCEGMEEELEGGKKERAKEWERDSFFIATQIHGIQNILTMKHMCLYYTQSQCKAVN